MSFPFNASQVSITIVDLGVTNTRVTDITWERLVSAVTVISCDFHDQRSVPSPTAQAFTTA